MISAAILLVSTTRDIDSFPWLVLCTVEMLSCYDKDQKGKIEKKKKSQWMTADRNHSD